MKNNSSANEVESENVFSNVDFSSLSNSLNEINYKMDSLVFRQEEQTGAISQGFGILFVFIIAIIIFKFISSFIEF